MPLGEKTVVRPDGPFPVQLGCSASNPFIPAGMKGLGSMGAQVCIYTRWAVCMCTLGCVYTHWGVCVYALGCVCIHTGVCICTHWCVCIHTGACIYTRWGMYIDALGCVYIYIHTGVCG